jgi:tetratricopeptide (TPR) repeat protein
MGAGAVRRVRQLLRRRERLAVVLYLTATAGVFGLFLVPQLRVPLLDRAERGLFYWEERWTRRVEHGESLLREGRSAEAIGYLERLNRIFPARHVKNRRDLERERLLRALAGAYAAGGRKRRALDTYAELVAFDPRNYESRWLQAEALERFAETDSALEAYLGVLSLHPSHLPSLKSVSRIRFERGDFRGVVDGYEDYLDAYLVERVGLAVDGETSWVWVPVDGRFHDVEARPSRERLSDPWVDLLPGRFAFELASLELRSPLRVGLATPAAGRVWRAGDPLEARDLLLVAGGSVHVSAGEAPRLRISPVALDGVARARLRVRLFKDLDAELWEIVEHSYRNRLEWDRLERARSRSRVTVTADGR